MTKLRELLKNDKVQVKEKRIDLLYKEAEKVYKRKIEDIEREMQDLKLEREGLIDLTTLDGDNVEKPQDIDWEYIAHEDINIGIKLKNHEIWIEEAKKRYQELFG